MTIHRIGKNPNSGASIAGSDAPGRPASRTATTATSDRDQRARPGRPSTRAPAARRAGRTASASGSTAHRALTAQRVADRVEDCWNMVEHRRQLRRVGRVARATSGGSAVSAGSPRIEASSTSTVWASAIGSPGRSSADGHLHQAARVGGDQQLGAGGERRCAALRSPSSRGRLGVEQVVDAGRAAADLRRRRSPQLQPGDAAQQRARLRADALGVRQVAGVVVGDGHRQRVPRRRPGRARRGAR